MRGILYLYCALCPAQRHTGIYFLIFTIETPVLMWCIRSDRSAAVHTINNWYPIKGECGLIKDFSEGCSCVSLSIAALSTDESSGTTRQAVDQSDSQFKRGQRARKYNIREHRMYPMSAVINEWAARMTQLKHSLIHLWTVWMCVCVCVCYPVSPEV